MDAEGKKIMKPVILLFSVFLGLWFLKIIFPVISLIIIALLVVYLIFPLVDLLVKLHIPRPAASVIIFVFFIAVISLAAYFFPLTMYREIRLLALYLATDFRHYVLMLLKQLEQIDLLLDTNLTKAVTSSALSFIEDIPAHLFQWIGRAPTLRIPFLSELWSLLGLFFLILFLLFDLDAVKTTLISLFPRRYRREATHIISVIDDKVGAYLRGNLIRCLLVGLATGVGLKALGMPFVFILSLTAGLLNIIYNIGPILAAIPAILLSLTPHTPHPVFVLLLYAAIQAGDHLFLFPRFMGKAVDLRPVTIVIAILCGARLLGLLGIILAIPFAAIAKVLLHHYYLARMVVDKNEEGP